MYPDKDSFGVNGCTFVLQILACVMLPAPLPDEGENGESGLLPQEWRLSDWNDQHRTLCACDINEYWAGSACQACPVGSFSAGQRHFDIVHVMQY